jgi:hypothetical protein
MGLKKVFDTGSVPNPGFVQISTKLPASVADKVGAAVVGYGGGGAIAGWAKPSLEPYRALAAHLGRATKLGVFAPADPVRVDVRDVLIEPTTLRDTAFVPARTHFVRPPGARME